VKIKKKQKQINNAWNKEIGGVWCPILASLISYVSKKYSTKIY